IRTFNRALESGDDWRFYHDRAQALWHQQRFEEMLADFDRALALWPGDSELLVGRASARWSLKRDADRAAADIAMVERLDPGSEYLDYYRTLPMRAAIADGAKLVDAGKYDDAIAKFTWAHEAAPGKTDALSRRGDAYLKKKDPDRALADFEEDIRL